MDSKNLLTIDGQKCQFEPGETILEVAQRNSFYIPTLCHLKGTTPTGACRVCVVEVEGARNLVAACATPADNNMVVHTNSPPVLEARRTIISLLLNSGNHNCAIGTKVPENWAQLEQKVKEYEQSEDLCPAYGACKLQALAYRYQVKTNGLVRREPEYPMEMASPLIVRDFSRCILCGRCVEACNTIQVNNAISFGYRGAKAKIVAKGDYSLERSDCVFCGQCIQVCPVGALTEKEDHPKARPWELRHVRTTCSYCGVGCQMDLHIKDNQVVKVTAPDDVLPNQGRLCAKGRFGYDFIAHSDRLKTPLIKENGKFREADWDEALDLVAKKLHATKEKWGPDSLMVLTSARITNEENYLAQKFARAVLGTNNVDHCARL